MSELNLIKERAKKAIFLIKKFKEEISFIILMGIMAFSYKIRTSNLVYLKDFVTGKYIPGDPDAAAFLRYAKYILENGSLMSVDTLRYYPLGYDNLTDFSFLSHFIVYLYKFLHFFNSSITLEYVDVIFPAITFAIALIPFYFLVKKLFDFKVALLASAFLTVMPPFLYRTISGVGDKEALGIIFFFSAFYFFVLSIKSEHKYGYLLALPSGISTALMGLVWGGVNFIFLTIAITILIKIALSNLKRNEFYSYVIWWFSTFILLNRLFNFTYHIRYMLLALTIQFTILALISGFLYFLINYINIKNLKERLNKYPVGLICIGISVASGLIYITFFSGLKPTFIIEIIQNLVIDLTRPFSRNRWALTVAESQQPFVNSWFGNFGTYFMYLFLISAVVLFYESFKENKKHKYVLTAIFSLFLSAFIFSRYSSDSILNGKSTFSLMLYLGSLILFVVIMISYFLYSFYKDHELYKVFTQIDSNHIFILAWFLITAIAARSAVRLIFVFVPITTILVSYILIKLFDYGIGSSNKAKKIISILIVAVLIFSPSISGSLIERGKLTVNTAKATGPSFDQQWQSGMSWVRENTPKESVFAHWWDYGYWVQTFGERATLSDGGNARGAINHFIGRHLLTGRNNTEALELLKTHNATHVLIVSDEIGKYTAFSSIGADENYDKFSHIPMFSVNPEQIQEARDEQGRDIINYLYAGNFAIDEDFKYQDKFFPKNEAGIIGVIVTVRILDQNNTMEIGQPKVILVHSNNRYDIPLNCLYLENKEYIFKNEEGYEGCFRTIPIVVENNQISPIGGGLLLSPNTRNTLFSQLYLFDKNEANNQQWQGFEKIYDDTQKGYTLAYYVKYGRTIGPLKIWKVNYPSNIKTNPIYLQNEPPNPDVEKVREF